MILYILSFPLLSAICAGFFGRKLGQKGGGYLTSTLIIITAILSWILFYFQLKKEEIQIYHLGNWIQTPSLNLEWTLAHDSVTIVMMIVVTTISALVHLYSTGYMAKDPHLPRFMSYLSLFTFFMLVLVTGHNYPFLFIGWEGVGVCSYLLISFWYTRIQANKAAIKAMILNRIGDLAFSLAMFTLFCLTGSLDFGVTMALAPYLNENGLTIVCLLFFLGAVGKSAQLGLHTWLPDAMEGPTPVSALIHAATMVTAGIYLLLRSSPLFEFSSNALWILTIVGGLTAFFAATIGVVQNDIKKVIAYSTCSQLGYMMLAAGISSYQSSLFHLANHAFFKALLFLSAGTLIHALADEQDLRRMGGLSSFLPFSLTMIGIGSLALTGLPFLAGFYSKDGILETSWAHGSPQGIMAFWLGTLAAFLTAFYSIRLLILAFLTRPNYPISTPIHEGPLSMSFPLIFLAIGSILLGYLGKDLFLGLGSPFFGQRLFNAPQEGTIWENESIPISIKWIPIFFSIGGMIIATWFYSSHIWTQWYLIPKSVYQFLVSKWYLDTLPNKWIERSLFQLGYHGTYKLLDLGILETLGPQGLIKWIWSWTKKGTDFQSGHIYHYALLFLAGITFYIWIS